MIDFHPTDLTFKLKANVSKNVDILRCWFLEGKKSLNKYTDVFIASYPRSGNTWLRLLMSDVILQINGFNTDTNLPIHQNFVIPDIHSNDVNSIDSRLKIPYRLLKTHGIHNHIKGKLIYLFRNPSDSLVSYYHFHLRYKYLTPKVSTGIDIFCQKMVHQWYCHVNFYTKAKLASKTENNILFVSYEMLHQKPVETLNTIMDFYYGCEVDKDLCHKAVNNHVFQKYQSREKLDGYSKPFFRKGKVGNGEKELTKKTVFLIKKETSRCYDQAIELAQTDFNKLNKIVDRHSSQETKFLEKSKIL